MIHTGELGISALTASFVIGRHEILFGLLAAGLCLGLLTVLGQSRALARQLRQARVALQSSEQAEAKMRLRCRDMSALASMATSAARTFDLDELLRGTLQSSSELFGQRSDVLLFDVDSSRILRNGLRCESLNAELQLLLHELTDFVAETHAEVITELDLSRLPQSAKTRITEQRFESFIAARIATQIRTLGILLISSPNQNQFTERDHSLASAIASQLGTFVERASLYIETKQAYEKLRNTRTELLQTEKMAAVSKFISGVTHELNNPLTAILGYAQLLETEPIGDRAQDFVNKLYRQAQRTHHVVQSLLSFARQRKPIQSQVDLRRVMEDTLSSRDLDIALNQVALEREYAHDLPPVIGDAHQLEQVFRNIINNAVDAILETEQSGSLKVRLFAEDSCVCAEFWDSGPGLTDHDKAFDPFYTTKKIGKGSGLGLSICYGLVKEQGGEIQAFNHQQGGAVFQVRLPTAP